MLLGLSNSAHIPKRFVKKYSNIVLLISVILSISMSYLFVIKLRPAFLSVFTPYAINIGSDAINFTVAEYFHKNTYSYNDYITLTYNQNNEITSLQTNTALMNKVKADLSIYLQEEIIKIKTYYISIPFGNVFDNILLHGIGPDIKIRVSPTDITDLNFNETFEEAGINQVRHKIFIDVYVTISIHCASMTKSEVIHDIIPVAETVIVGQVPKYYSQNDNLPLLTTQMEE